MKKIKPILPILRFHLLLGEVVLYINMYYLFMFQLGGGYLFGLPIGFIADSIGATIGAVAAFYLGRTVSP